MQVIRGIFITARIITGLVGLWWLLMGVYGVFATAADGEWALAAAIALYALFGFCLAYGAFVRYPWEPYPETPG